MSTPVADLPTPQDPAAAVPGAGFDPMGGEGEVTTLDSDANGLVDTLLVTFADGSWSGSFDVTGDGEANVFAVSTTGAAEPDLLVIEDGAGGYVLQVDTNGDGVPDTDVAMTREQLQAEFPAALEFLDLRFGTEIPQADPTDPTDPMDPMDPMDPTDPAVLAEPGDDSGSGNGR